MTVIATTWVLYTPKQQYLAERHVMATSALILVLCIVCVVFVCSYPFPKGVQIVVFGDVVITASAAIHAFAVTKAMLLWMSIPDNRTIQPNSRPLVSIQLPCIALTCICWFACTCWLTATSITTVHSYLLVGVWGVKMLIQLMLVICSNNIANACLRSEHSTQEPNLYLSQLL
jgi:hypothetical protein